MKSRRCSSLEVLRFRQWRHLIVLPLVGLDLETWVRAQIGAWEVFAALLCAGACLGFAYGLNGIAERRTDACPAKNPLVGHPRAVPIAIARVVLAALVGLALASSISTVSVVAVSVSLVAGALYSVGARAKAKPIVGLLFNAFIFVPLCFLLYDSARVPETFACELAIFVALLTQNQLLHELADLDEDRRAGAQTTAQLLGEGFTRRVSACLGLVLLGVPWLFDAPIFAFVIAAVLGGSTATICLSSGTSPGHARILHRRIALLGGAALFLTGHA